MTKTDTLRGFEECCKRLGYSTDNGVAREFFMAGVEAAQPTSNEIEELRRRWTSAADKLLSYIEAHGWGTIPEPWDSITPLYELMYSRCPTCQNLDRRGDRTKRDHARIPDFICSDKWHEEKEVLREYLGGTGR